MDIFVTYYDEHRTQKPNKPQTGAICKECSKPQYVDTEKWLSILLHGGTTRPCAINGTHDYQFVSGQSFIIDIDNEDKDKTPLPKDKQLKPDQALQLSLDNGLHPFFIYYSFNSTEDCSRYRIGFIADKPLTDVDQWKYCQLKIFSIFPHGTADPRTNHPSRMFFGTSKGLFYKDVTAVVSVNDLLSGYTEPQAKSIGTTARKPSPKKRSKPNRVAQAIADHDSAYIRRYMGRGKKIVFDNRQQFYDYIYKTVSLADFLGVDEQTPFSCILPTHGSADEHPSASVFVSRSGAWLYKCFAEDVTLNIKKIVEMLGNYDSEYQALEFLKDALNLKIKETQWAIEQRENIDSIVSCLCGTDENAFSSICPMASHNLRNCKLLLLQILCIARNCIYPERASKDRNIIFYMSVRRLAKDMGKTSTDQIERNLKMLTYHKVINELSDEEIPPQFLEKANANRQQGHRRVSFYEIPSWVVQRTQLIEQQGRKWKENGYRIRGISYEMFLRNEGQAVASWMYPQHSRITTRNGIIDRKTSRKSDEMHEEITDVVTALIMEKGYCTESEIAEYFEKKHGKNITDLQIKRSIGDVMTANNLHKQKCNKALKQRLSIQSKGYPIVIVQNE